MSETPGDGPQEEIDPVQKILDRERFSQARFDVGYVREDVDALVAELRRSYELGGNLGRVIESHKLRAAGFREGYEVSEVETWLRDLARESGTELGPRDVVTSVGQPKTEKVKKVKKDSEGGFFSRFRRRD